MTSQNRKPEKSKQPGPKNPGSGSSGTKQKLREIKDLLPPEEQAHPEDTSKPMDTPKKPQEILATGSLSKIVCTSLDILFAKLKKSALSEQEKDMLSKPLNEVEVRYLPAIVNKYADKASPFIELAMVGYMIYENRKEKKPQEKPQEEPEKPEEPKVT